MFISMRLRAAAHGGWRGGPVMPLVLAFALVACAGASGRAAPQPGFFDDLNRHDKARWERSDGWSNGEWVGCSWAGDHVVFDQDRMTLVLDDRAGVDKPMSCAEYRTREHLHYGRYEVSMKAARGDGLVTAFFIYTGPAFGDPWHETTIEILGRDTSRVQFTLFVDGEHYPTTIDLDFDAAEGFHTYAIEWLPDTVRWYVDGRLVHENVAADQPIPSVPGRIFTSLWNGADSLKDWLGSFRYDGEPITAAYEWIRYTPLGEQ